MASSQCAEQTKHTKNEMNSYSKLGVSIVYTLCVHPSCAIAFNDILIIYKKNNKKKKKKPQEKLSLQE